MRAVLGAFIASFSTLLILYLAGPLYGVIEPAFLLLGLASEVAAGGYLVADFLRNP